MTRSSLTRRTALPMIALLAWCLPATAAQRGGALAVSGPVGDTSTVQAGNGEVVAGQRHTTGPADTLEVILPDGTSIVLGGDTTVLVEVFDYDPVARTGRLVLRLERGRVRIAGGWIDPVYLDTPTAEVVLSHATAFVAVEGGETRTHLVFGERVVLTSGGVSEALVRPGFQLVSSGAGGPPAGPVEMAPERVVADVLGLNPRLLGPAGGGGEGRAVVNSLADLATEDRVGVSVEISASRNSVAPAGTFNFSGFGLDDGLASADGFGPGELLSAEDLAGKQAVQFDGSQASLTQSTSDPFEDVFDFNERARGATTNRRFKGQVAFEQDILRSPPIDPEVVVDDDFDDPDPARLEYVFLNAGTMIISAQNKDEYSDPDGPFGFRQSLFIGSGSTQGMASRHFIAVADSDDSEGGDDGETRIPGTPFGNAIVGLLQAGFSMTPPGGVDGAPSRSTDNFFYLESYAALVTQNRVQRLQELVENGFDSSESDAVLAQVNLTNWALPKAFETPSELEDRIEAVTDALLSSSFESELATLVLAGEIDEDDQAQILDAALFPTAGIIDPNPVPSRAGQIAFSTGDVDGERVEAFSVDRYFISPGLNGFDETTGLPPAGRTVAESNRAFLRGEATNGVALADSGLVIVNRTPEAAGVVPENRQNAVLHADFGIAGERRDQRSSISLTLGELEYCAPSQCTLASFDVEPGIEEGTEAVVRGRTLGSSRDNDRPQEAGEADTNARGSTFLSSPLLSTAAGGGNPALDKPGRAGYLVLENFELDEDLIVKSSGVERPVRVGGGEEVEFALLRLATAIDSQDEAAVAPRTDQQLQGWMSGLSEVQGDVAIGISRVTSGTEPTGFRIETRPDTNRLSVVSGFGSGTIELGGVDGPSGRGASAFIDDRRFAARTLDSDGREFGLVTANLVADGIPDSMRAPIRDYKYLQWGYFFGDTLESAPVRQHLHLATWVAGRVPNSDDLPKTGTATYSGHAVGNVYNNGDLYTAVGAYQNTWDFATRQATVAMDFDQAAYMGQARLRNGSTVFDGTLSGANRSGGVQGTFIEGGGVAAAGVIGQFAIRGDTGERYRAAGTFAAER